MVAGTGLALEAHLRTEPQIRVAVLVAVVVAAADQMHKMVAAVSS